MALAVRQPVRGWFFHGVRDRAAFAAVCRDGLRLPTEHASDPGDLGRGVYLTKSRSEALHYATGGVLAARVDLKSAFVLNFKKGTGRPWYNAMTQKFGGNPVNGDVAKQLKMLTDDEAPVYGGTEQWADRNRFAGIWHEALIADGVDGLVTVGWDLGETVVLFQPEKSVLELRCFKSGNEARRFKIEK